MFSLPFARHSVTFCVYNGGDNISPQTHLGFISLPRQGKTYQSAQKGILEGSPDPWENWACLGTLVGWGHLLCPDMEGRCHWLGGSAGWAPHSGKATGWLGLLAVLHHQVRLPAGLCNHLWWAGPQAVFSATGGATGWLCSGRAMGRALQSDGTSGWASLSRRPAQCVPLLGQVAGWAGPPAV